MKALDAIRRVDILEPNQYGVDQKLRWLSLLDGQIYEELISAYEPGKEKPGEYVTGEEELLAAHALCRGNILPLPPGNDSCGKL